jgi:hypothetical protein
MIDDMIFLTDMLDTESLNDEKYKQIFNFMLKDSKHVSLSDRVDDVKHQQK